MSTAPNVDETACAEGSKECSVAVHQPARDNTNSVDTHNLKKTEKGDGEWNAEDDDRLFNAVEQYYTVIGMQIEWNEVAKLVSGRSASECESRWLWCRADVQSWTEEDDQRLRQAVLTHGETEKAWRDAGEKRNWTNCRFRWQQYLHPDLRGASFSEEEDRILVKSVEELDGRWKDVVTRLPGRSKYGIEDHWNVNVRPRVPDGRKTADPILEDSSVIEYCLQEESTTNSESQALVSDMTETEVSQLPSTVSSESNQTSHEDVDSDVCERKQECLEDNSIDSKATSDASHSTVSVGHDAAVPTPTLKEREGTEMVAIKSRTNETGQTLASLDLCEVEETSSSKEDVINQPGKAPNGTNGENKKESLTAVDSVTTTASGIPQVVVSSSENTTTQLHVSPAITAVSQITGSKSSISTSTGAITGLLLSLKSSGGEQTAVSQPKIYQNKVQPVSLSTSVFPTPVVYCNQGSVVSSATKLSSSVSKPMVTSSVTGVRNVTVNGQKSHGIATVHFKLPDGQFIMSQSLVKAPTGMSQPFLQRPQSSTTNSTSVLQPARMNQSTVRPALASVSAASAGKIGDLARVRKPQTSVPARVSLCQPGEMKSKSGSTSVTKAGNAGRQIQVTLSVCPPKTALVTVTTWPGSAFSAVASTPKVTSSLPDRSSNISIYGIPAQNAKGTSMPSNQQQVRTQHQSGTLNSHSLKIDTQRQASVPVMFQSHATVCTPVTVATQQNGSKSLQTRPNVINKQQQVTQGQSRPAFTATRLESSGATSSVRAALTAATTQQNREVRTISNVISPSTSLSGKPASGNLPPPPALIHTPKTSLSTVSKRDVISTSTRMPSVVSSGSELVMSASIATSAQQQTILYNVGGKKLGNLNPLGISESKRNEAGQQKKRNVDKVSLQNDGGMKRVKIVTGKAVSNKDTEARPPGRRSSTLTPEDIALMERFGDWEDSASSESDNNKGESQQSIRDDPDFRPTSIRSLKQITSADGESDDDDDDNHPSKRKKDGQSTPIDESRNGCEMMGSSPEEGSTSPDKLGNQRKPAKQCRHCGSARFFSRGENFIYCTVCKRKFKQQVSDHMV